MVSKYTNVALPEELISEIDLVVKKSGLSYTSRGEIVKEAVQRFSKNKKGRERGKIIQIKN